MPAATARHQLLLIAASVVCFVTVGAALFLLEVPGLGIAHLIYLPVAFMALATNARLGASAGAFATLGYLALGLLSPRFGEAKLLTVSTAVIAVTSIAFGGLIGWTAETKRGLLRQLHELAQRDFLTGLLNLRAFESSLAAGCADGRPFALLLADLDGLKSVNDRDGHHAGNVLLQRVAEALREELPPEAEAARVGGDEFAFLLPGLAAPDEVESTSKRLERRLERRGLWLSFGWAAFPADANTSVELFRRADQRLYSSKLARVEEARPERRSLRALSPPAAVAGDGRAVAGETTVTPLRPQIRPASG